MVVLLDHHETAILVPGGEEAVFLVVAHLSLAFNLAGGIPAFDGALHLAFVPGNGEFGIGGVGKEKELLAMFQTLFDHEGGGQFF